MADNSQSDWRTAAGGPARKAAQHGWQQDDPKADLGKVKHRSKLFFLAALGGATVVGIFVLIGLLWPGKHPGILTISADPDGNRENGLARLDVPYDPYGWLSATKILDWAAAARKQFKNAPEPLRDKPFWLEDEKENWLEKVGQDPNVDPVIIYVGLHGGVNANGEPVLYSGRMGNAEGDPERNRVAVPLASLLSRLKEKAPNHRKVLILDTGRNLPDPNLGELSSEFAKAVKTTLTKTIEDDPKLAVILGADANQRGWNSDELGMTALAYQLVKTLTTGGDREKMSTFRTDELFERLRREVESWAQNNRPSEQSPVLIPAPEVWLQEGAHKKEFAPWKFYQLSESNELLDELIPKSTALSSASAELKSIWADTATLAAQIPSPATYTPLAWRRYRELLLRYELAAMSGDAVAANELRPALGDLRKTLEKGHALKLDDSRKYAIPTGIALGQTGEGADAARKLARIGREALAAPTLAEAASLAQKSAAEPPVELHLPIMMQQFVQEILDPDSEDPFVGSWKPALATRNLAERAAFGWSADPSGELSRSHIASERLWPLVRPLVLEGDRLRRNGEDRLFATPNPAAKPQLSFEQADRKYNDALAIANRLRGPIRLREELFSDLPFLTRWATEAEPNDTTDLKGTEVNPQLLELWQKAYALNSKIETYCNETVRQNPEKVTLSDIEEASESARVPFERTKRHINSLVGEQPGATSQTNWQSIQQLLLLPCPILSPNARERLWQRSREISGKLTGNEAELKRNAKVTDNKATQRLAAAAESLAGDWGSWAITRAALDRPSTLLNADDRGEVAKSASILQRHRQLQFDLKKYAETNSNPDTQAELFSRLAVPFTDLAEVEPATRNAWKRWRVLLEAHAYRAAMDHWYDTNKRPYFAQTIAGKLLKDAEGITRLLKDEPRVRSEDVKKALELAAAGRLSMTGDSEGDIRWTSESDRNFKYTVTPNPYPVEGEGVFWWQTDKPQLLKVDSTERQLADLKSPFENGTRSIAVRAGDKIEDIGTKSATANLLARGYFRGQYDDLKCDAKVRINRQPDLVVTDVRRDVDSLLCIRTDKQFNPGLLNVVLDFSGSMTYEWGKAPDAKEAKNTKDPKDSKAVAMNRILEELLPQLPAETLLGIRYLVGNSDLTSENSVVLDAGPAVFAKVREIRGGTASLIEKLKKVAPDGLTPLLPTIGKSMEDISAFNYSGVKTLLVLTDGADTTKQEQIFGMPKLEKLVLASEMRAMPEKRAALVAAVHKELEKYRKIESSIHVVIFGADDDEEKLAEDMYKIVEGFETPGRVYRAKDRNDLLKELEAAFRPKPRLLLNDSTLLPVRFAGKSINHNIPKNGIPTNRDDDGPGRLWWRGFLPADLYTLKYLKATQSLAMAPGDSLTVRMLHGSDDKVRFAREIYYRDVDPVTPGNRVDSTNDWYLTAPEYRYVVDSGLGTALTLIAALEDKRSAIPPRSSDIGSNTLREVDSIGHVRPAFVWWDVTQVDDNKAERRFAGPVQIYNNHGDRAPSWRFVGKYENEKQPIESTPFLLRSWPSYTEPPAIPSDVRPTIAQLREGVEFKISPKITLAAKFEKLPFVPDDGVGSRLSNELKQPSNLDRLVVRVWDRDGKRLKVQVRGLSKFEIAEHRYYYDANDPDSARPRIAGYTAVFGLISPESIPELGGLEIRLLDVSDFIEKAVENKRPLKLELDRPSKAGALDTPSPNGPK